MELAELNEIKEDVVFTPTEFKFFLKELKMRNFEEIKKCINNARYLAEIERAHNELESGGGVKCTFEELENFVNGGSTLLRKVS